MSDPPTPLEATLPRGQSVLRPIVEVHFDGACQPPHGGIATYGFTVEGAGLAHEEGGLAVAPGTPTATNNVAEYTAAIRGLEWLLARGYSGIVLLVGDSQLVLRQLTGEYEVRAEHLHAYRERLRQLIAAFSDVRLVWVPREENRRADELSKHALEIARMHRPGRRPAPR
jgi:ribonuclease HI